MTNCSVCLDTLSTGPITALSCGHVFHHNCITLWTTRQPHCPLCKKPTNHRHTPLIPLYLEMTGQPTVQDPSTLSVSFCQQDHSRDQYKQLQNQLQSTRQKLKMERQQFENEKRQFNKETQTMKNIKEVLELEACLSLHQVRSKIHNWKAMPHDQLGERMGVLVERHGSLAKELDETILELQFSKKRIQQLKALSRSSPMNYNTREANTTHMESHNGFKRKRLSPSADNISSAKRLDKKPVIYLDAADEINGDNGASGTRIRSSLSPGYTQQNGQSSNSGGSTSGDGSSSNLYAPIKHHISSLSTQSQVKYEAPTSENTPRQHVVSIIDSDDECPPAIPASSRVSTRNMYTPSASNTSNQRLIVLLSDDEDG